MTALPPATALPVDDAPEPRPLRRGDPCPRCGQGRLDYNGMLALACDRCDFAESEAPGCT